MSTGATALAALVGLAWVPVLIKFFRAWRERKNPISLAICGVIALCIYLDIMGAHRFFGTSVGWIATAIIVANAVVCGFFYLSFQWSKKMFPDARGDKQPAQKRKGSGTA
jgi:peptidoglycan biosynthesis protein MviN/MurJ (putative lipid II flippase)